MIATFEAEPTPSAPDDFPFEVRAEEVWGRVQIRVFHRNPAFQKNIELGGIVLDPLDPETTKARIEVLMTIVRGSFKKDHFLEEVWEALRNRILCAGGLTPYS